MDNTQVTILAITSFIAGFLICKTWFATNIAEYFIYKDGYIQRVGETPPDETYPDLRNV